MPKVSLDNIVMIEKEVRFKRTKPGTLIEDEVCFVQVTDKMVKQDGVMAQECFYLSSNKKTYLFAEQDTSAHIDGELVIYPWQYKLRNNLHFRNFIERVDKNNMVEKKDLIALEQSINADVQKRGTKFMDDSRSQ